MSRIMNFDDTDPAPLETAAHDYIVTAFAAVQVMEAILYYDTHEKDSHNDPITMAELRRLKERNSAIVNLYFKRFRDRCFVVSYHGAFNDYRSHYDIDDALKAKFGDAVEADSESDWFCASSTESMKDEVTNYLLTEFPRLEFEVDLEDDVNNSLTEHYREPHFGMSVGGWTAAKRWLDEREIVVDYKPPKPSVKTGKELENLIRQARSALLKTGLPKEEAIKLL